MRTDEIPFSDLLSDVIDNRGKTCPTADAGIPLIATNCIRNELLYPAYEKVRFVSQHTYLTWFRGHPKPDDIIFVNKATPGRVCLVPNPVDFCIAQDMVAVRADPKKVTPKYLFAALRSPVVQERIAQMHVGTLIPHFKRGDFDKLLIPVPSRGDQDFIGAVYFNLSAKIELNRCMNETLEAMARALFKSWFVDFDPVAAKVEGRDTGLPAEIADLFPDSFEESELGPVPAGWKVDSVYAAAEVIYGAPFASAKFRTDGIGRLLVRIRDLANENPGIFTDEEHPKGYLVKPGDIIVGMDGEFRAHVWGGVEGWLNQRVCVFKPRPGYARSFVLHSIIRPLAEVEATETATTVIHLGKNDIDRFKIVMPDAAVLSTFNDLSESLLQGIVVNKRESRMLAALRDALLPKLISGEIRVGKASQSVRDLGA